MSKFLSLVVILFATPCFGALTQTQVSQHLRTIVVNGVKRDVTEDKGNNDFVRWCINYYKGGTVDQKEAATRILVELYEAQKNIVVDTQAEKHRFKHWIENTMSDDGFDAP